VRGSTPRKCTARTEKFRLLGTPELYVISVSSFSSIEEADDTSAPLPLLDAEFCPLCGKLVEDDALALAAAAWLLFLAAGTSWLCFPSYVVMTAFGSCDDLSICFFTSHP